MNLLELIPHLRLEMEPELAALETGYSMMIDSSSLSKPIYAGATPTQKGSDGAPPRLR